MVGDLAAKGVQGTSANTPKGVVFSPVFRGCKDWLNTLTSPTQKYPQQQAPVATKACPLK